MSYAARRLFILTVLLATASGKGVVSANELIELHGPEGIMYTRGIGVSDDGRTVAVQAVPAAGGYQAAIWTEATGRVELVAPSSIISAVGNTRAGSGIAGDGSGLFGYIQPNKNVIRTPAALFGPHAGERNVDGLGTIAAASYDGNVVVGQITIEGRQQYPFRWDFRTGFDYLETLDRYSVADDVSADGSIVVGVSESGALRWDDRGVKILGIKDASAAMISGDGSHVVVSGSESVIQRQSDFMTTRLEFAEDPSRIPRARGVNGDGSIVVGAYRDEEDVSRSFVWTPERLGEDLQTLLVDEFGIDFDDMTLVVANDISANGRFIVGNGAKPDRTESAWLVRLDRPIVVTTGVAGDFNGNAALDVEDLDLLTNEFKSGRDVALYDVNHDSFVDIADRNVWVHDLANTCYGDTNLDGEFTSGDLVTVFTVGKYETEQVAAWAEGDWNTDGVFGSGDLVLAFQDGGYEQGSRANVFAAPEPTSGSWVFAVGALSISRPRRKRFS
ncbi:MAG: hypothetical protein KDB23_16755 [Planctomycetales bacterium]|nr:hypothetical protein [Planctomycetales bacterium]